MAGDKEAPMAVLEVKGVVKSFDGEPPVLAGVDLKVEKGDVISILGPSGGGKTTLLRCLNFLERADAGTLTFGGATYQLATMKKSEQARVRKRTGFVFQNYNLFLNKTALENVTEGLIVARHMPAGEARQWGLECLQKVGMEDKARLYPNQLSGGQQQRVAIARALATRPELIYFDEPTSALDPELTGEVLSVMQKLAQEGMTMVVVTHEMGFARNVSSRVMLIEGGEVVEEAAASDFFERPAMERTKEFIGLNRSGK